MTEIERIEARMASGESFTLRQLSSIGEERIADRIIQRWRRQGLISFVRSQRQIIWSLTELGREQFCKQEKA